MTDKQEMFCREYLIDLNATQAAIRAGYKEENARQIGSENLTKLVIQERIQELMQERIKSVKYDAEDVLKDIRDIIQDNKGIDDKTALKGLELYGKHLKLFVDRVESKNLNANVEMDSLEEAEEYLKSIGIDPDKI